MRVLPQVGRPTHTFIEPAGIGENSDNLRDSLIDIALVGRKANRAWYAVKVGQAEGERSRQHLAMEVLTSNKKQNGPKHKIVFRYRPEKILPHDLIELKVKASKLRNNWKSCNREAMIQRLETLTNLVIETTKRLQESKAKIRLTMHAWGVNQQHSRHNKDTWQDQGKRANE